jgi:succinate-acetate transporter protein
MIGLLATGWVVTSGAGLAMGVLYALGGIMLALAGVLSVPRGRGLDTVVFLSLSALFFCLSTAYVFHYFTAARFGPFATPGEPPTAAPGVVLQPATGWLGWFAICWSVFFCYVWISSMKSGGPRILFLLFLWVALLAEALGIWAASMALVVLGGYALMISAVFGFIISAIEIITMESGSLLLGNITRKRTVTIEPTGRPQSD